MASEIPIVTIDDLREFHAKHFPYTTAPESFLHGVAHEEPDVSYLEEDDLGYYPDGTKRTLTDEQIAMFRHSEIRAILRQRRLQCEVGEVSEEGEAMSPPIAAAHQSLATTATSTPTGHPPPSNAMPANNRIGRGQPAGKQQWATSSERTRKANRRHRNKYKAKKREMRRLQEGHSHDNKDDREGDGTEESDEWDPWHQATGPDALKDTPLELDY